MSPCAECGMVGMHKLSCRAGYRATMTRVSPPTPPGPKLVQWEARATKGEATILVGLAAPANGHQALLKARTRLPDGWRITMTRVLPAGKRPHAEHARW